MIELIEVNDGKAGECKLLSLFGRLLFDKLFMACNLTVIGSKIVSRLINLPNLRITFQKVKFLRRKKFRHLVEDTFSKNPEIIEVLPNKANVVATKLLPHNDSLGMIQVWRLVNESYQTLVFTGCSKLYLLM